MLWNRRKKMGSRYGDEHLYTSISEDDLEENYYSILNVPSTVNYLFCIKTISSTQIWFSDLWQASDKEITQAYHRFGLVYHPDKHKDAVNKRNAEILFTKIKKAYDGE